MKKGVWVWVNEWARANVYLFFVGFFLLLCCYRFFAICDTNTNPQRDVQFSLWLAATTGPYPSPYFPFLSISCFCSHSCSFSYFSSLSCVHKFNGFFSVFILLSRWLDTRDYGAHLLYFVLTTPRCGEHLWRCLWVVYECTSEHQIIKTMWARYSWSIPIRVKRKQVIFTTSDTHSGWNLQLIFQVSGSCLDHWMIIFWETRAAHPFLSVKYTAVMKSILWVFGSHTAAHPKQMFCLVVEQSHKILYIFSSCCCCDDAAAIFR